MEELAQLKHANNELREKVMRQDAAWKRKIESERKGRGMLASASTRTSSGRAAAAKSDRSGSAVDSAAAVAAALASHAQAKSANGGAGFDENTPPVPPSMPAVSVP